MKTAKVDWLKVVSIPLLLASLGSTATAQTADRRNIEADVIQGNQEQPKVLYIVPWQAPESPDILVQKPEEAVEGVFRPIERDFYRQSLHFRRYLKIGVLSDRQ